MESYPLTGTTTAVPPNPGHNNYRPHPWDAEAAARPAAGGLDLMGFKYLSQTKNLAHPPFDPQDSAAGGTAATTDNCHIGNVFDGTSPAGKQQPNANSVRNWELIGGKQVDSFNKQTPFLASRGRYESAAIMFSGWEGGNGYDDCEDLARLMPNKPDYYNVDGEYSIAP